MVRIYNKKDFNSLLDYCQNKIDVDLFITEDNIRHIVKDRKTLTKLLKKASKIWIVEENNAITGILVIKKSSFKIEENKDISYYIKLSAIDYKTAKALISVLVWNDHLNLFIKIRKNSNFINIFKEKKFNFLGYRGREVIMNLNNKKKLIYERNQK